MEPETAATYQAILAYWEANALPPSLDDLAGALGKSKTAVAYQVSKLRELGKVITRPGIRRSILPVGLTITLPQEEEE